ncbi:MAG: hypothetical protein ABI854_03005, partial [Betaproteobacteria bacterium]
MPPPARLTCPYKTTSNAPPSIHQAKPTDPSCHCPTAFAVHTCNSDGSANEPASASVKFPMPSSHAAGETKGAIALSSYHTRALAEIALTASHGKAGRKSVSIPSVRSRIAINASTIMHTARVARFI